MERRFGGGNVKLVSRYMGRPRSSSFRAYCVYGEAYLSGRWSPSGAGCRVREIAAITDWIPGRPGVDSVCGTVHWALSLVAGVHRFHLFFLATSSHPPVQWYKRW